MGITVEGIQEALQRFGLSQVADDEPKPSQPIRVAAGRLSVPSTDDIYTLGVAILNLITDARRGVNNPELQTIAPTELRGVVENFIALASADQDNSRVAEAAATVKNAFDSLQELISQPTNTQAATAARFGDGLQYAQTRHPSISLSQNVIREQASKLFFVRGLEPLTAKDTQSWMTSVITRVVTIDGPISRALLVKYMEDVLQQSQTAADDFESAALPRLLEKYTLTELLVHHYFQGKDEADPAIIQRQASWSEALTHMKQGIDRLAAHSYRKVGLYPPTLPQWLTRLGWDDWSNLNAKQILDALYNHLNMAPDILPASDPDAHLVHLMGQAVNKHSELGRASDQSVDLHAVILMAMDSWLQGDSMDFLTLADCYRKQAMQRSHPHQLPLGDKPRSPFESLLIQIGLSPRTYQELSPNPHQIEWSLSQRLALFDQPKQQQWMQIETQLNERSSDLRMITPDQLSVVKINAFQADLMQPGAGLSLLQTTLTNAPAMQAMRLPVLFR